MKMSSNPHEIALHQSCGLNERKLAYNAVAGMLGEEHYVGNYIG